MRIYETLLRLKSIFKIRKNYYVYDIKFYKFSNKRTKALNVYHYV